MYSFVDVETTGLDARIDKLRIIAIDGTVYDVWEDDEHYAAAAHLDRIKHNTFVAHNAQFDLDFLMEHMGYVHLGPVYDTMVAYQIINSGRRTPEGKPVSAALASIVKQLLNVEMDKTYQKQPWDGVVDSEMLAYAAEDTLVLEPLVKELNAGLRKANLERIFQLEMKLLPVLLASKRRGVKVDRDALDLLIKKEEKEAHKLEQKLPMIETNVQVKHEADLSMALFQTAPESQLGRLNPRSSQQVVEYFGLPDATEDTLREYIKETDDDVAKNVRDIKKHLKKSSSLQKQLRERIRYDERIHPSFFQTFTETGRLSSREPNLQNQDRGTDVRSLFIPEERHKFVIADYSQLELRLAAYFSGDKNMLTAYREGRDLHEETQLRIFGAPTTKDEGKRTRTLSKNINFGLVFGGGHNTLIKFAARSGVDISVADAKEFKGAFQAAYPGLVQWQQKQGATDKEYVYTNLGRRRYITPGEGYCTRINNIVQGSAADGMKLAMVYLYYHDDILPLLNVHDEIVIECEERDADRVLAKVEERMIECMYRATKQNPQNPVVQIAVEAEIANSWADKT